MHFRCRLPELQLADISTAWLTELAPHLHSRCAGFGARPVPLAGTSRQGNRARSKGHRNSLRSTPWKERSPNSFQDHYFSTASELATASHSSRVLPAQELCC